MAFDIDMIKDHYKVLGDKVKAIKAELGRPLTLSEKILYSHLHEESPLKNYSRGKDYVFFAPDRVAMQDATAQMALLQFMMAGKDKVAVPSTVHCDHLIQAKIGADADLQNAINTSNEVFNFLESVSDKYGIGFWKPGAGIIHQVVLENYAFPGGMMIGTDSHTVNAGGLGMVAIGVGGADAVDVMAGMPWELKNPKLIGVKLTGKLSGWSSPKDVILKVADILTVKGGTGAIVEYFGDGAKNMSCTGKGTICNMGAEIGATTSTFGYDESMDRYLRATDRADIADAAKEVQEHLTADAECYAEPEKYFDQVIEINLSELKPLINGPFTPDLSTNVGKEMTEKATANDWPLTVEWGLIGSCTNSSYEDLSRSASIARQAVEKGLITKAEFGINPGSEQVRFTAERDGILKIFEDLNATIFTNACGPCIGQWARYKDPMNAPKNSIIHSFNRNFSKRADGNPSTHAFVASPEIVAAIAIAGRLDFNPMTDTLTNDKGEEVKFDEPTGFELPPNGFDVKDRGFNAPAEDGSKIEVVVDPTSERLQLLTPFVPITQEGVKGMRVLIKVKGKCTTDHISMAGPWLTYRGHLQNISENCYTGAINYFNDEANSVLNYVKNDYVPVPDSAKTYQANGIGTVVFGEENLGEGSSREHAAMEPRFLGVNAVIVKSFARIHETNLKKQGMLALTFIDKADYDLVRQDDIVSIMDFDQMAPGKPLTIKLDHEDGTSDEFKVSHTYNQAQIDWVRAGSALNKIREDLANESTVVNKVADAGSKAVDTTVDASKKVMAGAAAIAAGAAVSGKKVVSGATDIASGAVDSGKKVVAGAADLAGDAVETTAKAGKSILRWLLPLFVVLLGLGYLITRMGCSTGVDALDNAAEKTIGATENVVGGATDLAKKGAEKVVDGAGAVAGAAGDAVSGVVDLTGDAFKWSADALGSVFTKTDDVAKAAWDKMIVSAGSAGDQMKKFISNGFKGDPNFSLKNANFATGSAELSGQMKGELNGVVAFMKAYPGTKLAVMGYTDNTGDPDDNVTLSKNRAKSVMGFLAANGIDASRVVSEGYGQDNPIADNNTEKGRAQNRRIELRLMK